MATQLPEPDRIYDIARMAATETVRELTSSHNGILYKIAREAGREAAKESVEETLKLLGVDTTNPREMQKDFIILRKIRELLDHSWFSVAKLVIMFGVLSGALFAIIILVRGGIPL